MCALVWGETLQGKHENRPRGGREWDRTCVSKDLCPQLSITVLQDGRGTRRGTPHTAAVPPSPTTAPVLFAYGVRMGRETAAKPSRDAIPGNMPEATEDWGLYMLLQNQDLVLRTTWEKGKWETL